MATKSNVILFGDQTVDPCPLIKQLCRQSKHCLTLQAFLQKTYSAIRQELAISDFSDRLRFPSFDSILALADSYAQSNEPNEAVSTLLLCIVQLGLLLSYVIIRKSVKILANSLFLRSREGNDFTVYDTISSSTTYLVGLCTGMLPAAALASASSVNQLLELAPEIACISLRLGIEASRRSAQIEKSHESWATLVPGIPLQEQKEILQRFHQVYVRVLCLSSCRWRNDLHLDDTLK